MECEKSATLPSLKPLCPTRWTVRTGAVLSVLQNYNVLQDELDKIGQQSGEASTRTIYKHGAISNIFWVKVLLGICCC